MSAASETAVPARRPVRPFYWSVRRELWENRAVYLAPLAVGAVILAAFLYASHGLARELQIAERLIPPPAPPARLAAKAAAAWVADAPTRAGFALIAPYLASTFAILATATVVGVFYCLGALHGERRDRTVLFWKSLPVSDRTTVLSKAVVPLVILPLVAIAVTALLYLVLIGVSVVVLAGGGLAPSLLIARLPIWTMFVLSAYAMISLALWWAPLAGWLMLVSAWAKRMTFVWAVAPPAAVCLFERLAFGTDYAWRILTDRLHGGAQMGFENRPRGLHPTMPTLDQLHPAGFLAEPGLWGGLVVFAAFLAACVWLRRRREPI